METGAEDSYLKEKLLLSSTKPQTTKGFNMESPTNKKSQSRRLIFSSASEFPVAFPFALVATVVAIIFNGTVKAKLQRSLDAHLAVRNPNEEAIAKLHESLTAMAVLSTVCYGVLVFIVLVFLFMNPWKLRVYSDAVLEVDTIMRTYRFDQLRSARKSTSIYRESRGFRWNFSTTLSRGVFIKRQGNCLEVFCSPKDVEGMVNAINDVLPLNSTTGDNQIQESA